MTVADSEHITRVCFFVSPIGETGSGQRKAADAVLRHLVRKALEPLGLTVLRADQDDYPGLITTRTINLIRDATLIVADLTGHNPNVFYEMAVAHGLRRPTVHIQQVGEAIPFDVKDMRVLRYNMTDLDDLERAREQLALYAQHAIEHVDSLENPLSIAGKFLEIQQSGDPILASQSRLIEMVEALRADVHRFTVSAPSGVTRSEVDSSVAEIGVTRISPGGLAGAVLAEQIEKSRLIRIMSTSAVRLIESYTSAFTAALANGCNLRIMLPWPDGPFVSDVQKVESLDRERPTQIADEIKSVSVALSGALRDAADVAMRERNPNPLGTVCIGYFSTQLRSTMILCDDTWGWMTLTLPPARAADSPSLELSSTGARPLLTLCHTHFDFIWGELQTENQVRTITADGSQ